MSIEEIQPRIYRIPSILGPRRFAQWLVVGDERLLLVDSGIDGTIAEHVIPALAEIGRRPDELTDVVISHADVDHYGGNAELRRVAPNARIRSHALDRPWIEAWDAIARDRYGWYRHYGLDYEQPTWDWLHDAAGPDTPIDGTLDDGDVLDLGGIEVEVLHLPGHSPGHLGVLHRPSGTAIVMDAAMERGLYTIHDTIVQAPPYGSVPDYRATAERLRGLGLERLGTSHYADIEGREAVDRFLSLTLSFADDLDTVVRGALDGEPRPLAHFWVAADEGVGPFPEMKVELARTVGAHLELAEADGVAVRTERDGLPAWHAS